MTLDEMKELCEQATPGPWHCQGYDEDTVYAGERSIVRGANDTDARFIAAARTLLPKLIAVAEAAKDVDLYAGNLDAVDRFDFACYVLNKTLAALEAP